MVGRLRYCQFGFQFFFVEREQFGIQGVVTTLAGTGSSGSTNGTGTAASFHYPIGITTDGTNLYITEYYGHRVRKVVIDSAAVTTVAGSGAVGFVNATGTSAKFNYPYGITTDGTNLYVADLTNHAIRKIE